MLPMLFILVLGLLAVFFYRRRSRRDRASAGSRAMKVNQDANYAPMTYTTQQGPPLMMTRPPHLHPHPPHPAVTNIPRVPYPRPQSTQPIILGPMSQSNSGNYHTGLDTDVLSISESTIQRNGGFPIEDPDEPPPPYRPRSVVTFVSREASTRSGSLRPDAQVDGSTDHLIHGALAHPGRSPFADPDDDDAVSIISEPERHGGMRQGRDIMSDVSDLSYQNSFRRP
ncbi:hypothetical protein EJ05DRAFT_51919 [Pseudovirgaria hyperparasitica]|uniref:Uncharacterized protein n=1 Tax=Pseudovirgaria hyperparasitica TaxID=470096 RepID=A0A6A6W2D9_9PEZI|nr:uncharacterized protein EJ05DRAFT_51919 [Pseudovirgaria hyperparasitica]KAF2757022.1 hypothetical protein EJ05DRAFT_51919 [Pseudovirgaria hyperparasitica]